MTVVGDVAVEGVLKGSHNDDSFECHGVIRAGVILSDEHSFEATGGLSPRRRPESAGVWGEEIFDLRDEEHVAPVAEQVPELGAAQSFDDHLHLYR